MIKSSSCTSLLIYSWLHYSGFYYPRVWLVGKQVAQYRSNRSSCCSSHFLSAADEAGSRGSMTCWGEQNFFDVLGTLNLITCCLTYGEACLSLWQIVYHPQGRVTKSYSATWCVIENVPSPPHIVPSIPDASMISQMRVSPHLLSPSSLSKPRSCLLHV